MSERPSDQAARDRFTREWDTNFAVVANAGSGKTTAIARRLAALALSREGAQSLRRTAVVTYTNKAAEQIRQSARRALLGELSQAGGSDLGALARLEQAFFGTIHSFCIVLARRHGSALGLHLNPKLIEEEDDAPWEDFIDRDPMQFSSLSAGQVGAFLRHASLDDVFDLARRLDLETSRALISLSIDSASFPSRWTVFLGTIATSAADDTLTTIGARCRIGKTLARRFGKADVVRIGAFQFGDIAVFRDTVLGEPGTDDVGHARRAALQTLEP